MYAWNWSTCARKVWRSSTSSASEAASSGVEVHRMTMKGFQPTYVVYGWSYGSGGGTQDLLVTSDAAVMQTQCWGD